MHIDLFYSCIFPETLKCHLNVCAGAHADDEQLTGNLVELLQYIKLKEKYSKIKVPEGLNFDDPFWEQLESVERPKEKVSGVDLNMRCSSLDDYYCISERYNTGEMQDILASSGLSQALKTKHKLSNVFLQATISKDEFREILVKLDKAIQTPVIPEPRTPWCQRGKLTIRFIEHLQIPCMPYVFVAIFINEVQSVIRFTFKASKQCYFQPGSLVHPWTNVLVKIVYHCHRERSKRHG